MKTINEYIQEILTLSNEIAALEKDLEALDKDTSPDTFVLLTQSAKLSRKIEEILNTNIPVGLMQMLDNYSKLLNIPRSNLTISQYTNCKLDYDGDIYENIREKQKTDNAYIHFIITQTDDQKKFIKESSFRSKLDLDALQLDGKPFKEHCFSHTHVYSKDNCVTDIALSGYSDIVVNFPIRDLIGKINGSYQVKDALAQAVIDTYEQAPQSEQVTM